MQIGRIEIPFGAQNLIIETGKLAKQANGAVTVTCGGTVVLVTACMSKGPREGIDFFPLMVEYQEKTYSAGRIPGGFFKREGRPTEKEILTARVIDRPLRPLFPEGFYNDVQVVASVLSHDNENDPDVLALVGASTALMISDIPFEGPVGALRICMKDGEFVVNPSFEQREEAELDFVVAGPEEGIVMIEGEGQEIPEEKMAEALQYAHDHLKPIAAIQKEFAKENGKAKSDVPLLKPHPDLYKKVKEMAKDRLAEAYQIVDKLERQSALDAILKDISSDMNIFEEFAQDGKEVSSGTLRMLFDQIEYEEVRRLVFEKGTRADGRQPKDLRDISGEVTVLPRTHGSGLFVRGQTQSLSVVTLGTRHDEQMMETLEGTTYRTFMLHYNFPSFSVGETRPMRGPGRREIGHGALALKALKPMIPTKDDFPYTIRLVSEILESNGSSSMATVCAGSLALMDAGVPVKEPVAGISIGLISDEKRNVLLTDIMGLEDHFGDMDFKVAGTRKGITAIQLDLKIKKISVELLAEGMQQAKDARLYILDKMHEAIPAPREDTSEYAPRVLTIDIPPDKIGEVIGPGGKMIKKIIEETGADSIDIEDDGKVLVSSLDKESGEKAIQFIKGMTEPPEVGKIYKGKVKKIMNFGAFVEFLPGREGLVHVSELADTFVKDVESVVKVGDEFPVKLLEIDKQNRMNLSKKQAEE